MSVVWLLVSTSAWMSEPARPKERILYQLFANVFQLGQVRVLFGEGRHIGVGCLNCAVAGVAGNAAAVGEGLKGAGVGQGRGLLGILCEGIAFLGQPLLLRRRHQCDSGLLVRLDVPDVNLVEQGIESVGVCVVDTGDDVPGGVVLQAGDRRAGRG